MSKKWKSDNLVKFNGFNSQLSSLKFALIFHKSLKGLGKQRVTKTN